MGKISRWAQLHHKNVLPLYGIAHDFGHFPSLVTPWMNEGSLNDYIANRHLSLRSKLDIVSGLFGRNNVTHSYTCALLGQTDSSWPWLSLVFFYSSWQWLSLISNVVHAHSIVHGDISGVRSLSLAV